MKLAIAVVTLLIAAAAYAHSTYMPRAETEKCITSLEKRLDSIDHKVELILERLMKGD